MSRLTSIVLLISFTFQALATDVTSSFNKLSRHEKLNFVANELKSRPQADQDFIKKEIHDFKFPEYEIKENEVQFSYQGQKISFKPLSAGKVQFKGHLVDMGPGKLESAFVKLENLLTKKASIFDSIISSAYANASSGIALGVIVGLFVWGYHKNEKKAKEIEEKLDNACKDLRSKLEKVDIKDSLSFTQFSIEYEFTKKEHLTKPCYVRNEYGDSFCKKISICLREIKLDFDFLEAKYRLLKISGSNINETDRGLIKDTDDPSILERRGGSDPTSTAQ
jgi:hypothetical protein